MNPEEASKADEPEEQNEPSISLDEFLKLRDDFFANLPSQIETLKHEVVEAMSPFDAFDVLTNLLIANMPLNVETYRESTHEGLFVVVEYAGLLLLERPSREGDDPERLRPLDGPVIRELQAKLEQMLSLSSFAAMHAMTSDGEARPRAIDEVRRQIVQRELFLRNPTYEWQERETLIGLFGGNVVSVDLRASVGFDVEDALAFSKALWDIGFERFRTRAEESRELEKYLAQDVQRATRNQELKDENLAPVVELLSKEPKRRQTRLIRNMAIGYAWTRAGDAMQVTPLELAEAAGRSEDVAAAFLDAFSLDFRQSPTFELRGSHRLRSHPIISDGEGNYLCTYHGNVLFALRARLEQALKPETGDSATTQRWERYNKVRAKYVEERAVSLLSEGLKTTSAWLNPTYVIGDGDRVEIDGLVVLDTVAFVVEAKGAALSAPARRALEGSLKRDIEGTLERATEQANRLTAAIEAHERIAISDADGKPIPFDATQLTRVFAVVVTLDDFSGLSTSAWALAEAELLDAPEPFPWIVNLHELEVILDLLDYAAQLPHFLLRRSRINELKVVRGADELDFFVFYLLHGLYFDDMLEDADPRPDFVGIPSMTDDVDAYYLSKRRMRKKKVKKPSMKIDSYTTRFLRQLDEHRQPAFVEGSIALLTMSDESRREFSKNVRRATALAAQDGAFHDATLVFLGDESWGLTVISAPTTRASELPERLQMHITLKKHQIGADLWVGFGILVDDSRAFYALALNYSPWIPDDELDEAVDAIFENQPSLDQVSNKKRQHLQGLTMIPLRPLVRRGSPKDEETGMDTAITTTANADAAGEGGATERQRKDDPSPGRQSAAQRGSRR